MRHALRVVLAIAFAAATLHAANDWLTGTWRTEVHGEAKTFAVVLHFTSDGKKVGGSVEIPSHDLEFPISKGTVNGNEVAFEAAGLWRGKLEGKELKLTRELDGGKKQQMVAHRSAE
ncbi:MAG TPA: hypothetical protein VH087_00750 [Thermoanaerobaculia bacterium]|jgi:hypothetical protein|nr:hypothetical protein [Thermoanaerobaculia bacterium]